MRGDDASSNQELEVLSISETQSGNGRCNEIRMLLWSFAGIGVSLHLG